jgi:hypothetical protein
MCTLVVRALVSLYNIPKYLSRSFILVRLLDLPELVSLFVSALTEGVYLCVINFLGLLFETQP